jgi:non-homologous end joining protein Ku
MANAAKKSALRVEVEGKTVAKINLLITGLFSFPVKLYSPVSNTESYSLHLGCPDCKAPVQQPRRCSNEKCDNHKGFASHNPPIRVAVEGETAVQIEDSDLEELNLPTAEAFVTEAVISTKDAEPYRLFGEGGYYLVPENMVANMAYAAVCGALKKSKQVIVGRYTLRGKQEKLALILPMEDALVIQNIPFYGQVRPVPKVLDDANISAKDIAQAQALMAVAGGSFDYQATTDRYADAMRELVTDKIKGTLKKGRSKKKVSPPPADAGRRALDEMFAASGVAV